MGKTPTAFISYSWDSEEHQYWVLSLGNSLRKKGIDAAVDRFETQTKTVNLYTMMVEKIRDNDYVIIVLTPNYAEKANNLDGGVGFETTQLIPLVQNNLEKIIPIVRCSGDASQAIPTYLTGTHYLDFSNPNDFNEVFEELLHRIYRVDLVEKSPLGERPDLQPRRILHKEQDEMGGFKVPNLRKVTDADKDRFMRSSFHEIKGRLTTILESTKAANDNFDFHQDDITSRKSIFKMYIDGSQKCAIKIWLGNSFGGSTDSINLSHGNSVSDSDNSVNEIIICEVDKDKELKLKMTLFGNCTAGEPADIVKEIWDTVMPYLR